VLAARSPGDLVNELTGVSCMSGTSCLSVGDDGTAKQFSTKHPLAETPAP